MTRPQVLLVILAFSNDAALFERPYDYLATRWILEIAWASRDRDID